ncbi:hypothetical protein LTR40_006038, partial [Exophiala xenobiotica]
RLIQKGANIGALSSTQHSAVRISRDIINHLRENGRGWLTNWDPKIQGLIFCFRDSLYGDFAACEERLNERQALPSAHHLHGVLLLCQALGELENGNESRAVRLVQLSFVVRRCAELLSVDRAAFFKSLKLGHAGELARVFVDFHILMYHFKSALRPRGALHNFSHQAGSGRVLNRYWWSDNSPRRPPEEGPSPFDRITFGQKTTELFIWQSGVIRARRLIARFRLS